MKAQEFHEAFGEHADYWADDDTYPYFDWLQEVASSSTRLGYWDWVLAQRDSAEDDELVRELTGENNHA